MLGHYENDPISWAMTHNEASRKGRLANGSEPVAYLFRFIVVDWGVEGFYWQRKLEAAPKTKPAFFERKM